MGRILDDPNAFFDNLSDEGFFQLLDDMGINYSKQENESKKLQQYKNFKENIMRRIGISNVVDGDTSDYYFTCNIDTSNKSIKGILDRGMQNKIKNTFNINKNKYSKFDVNRNLGNSYVEAA